MARTAAPFRPVVALLVVAVWGAFVACAPESELDAHLAEAAVAARAADWSSAFTSYLAAVEVDPANREAQRGAERTAGELLAAPPDLDVMVAGSLMRWLEGEQRWDDLIALLDKSTVAIPAGRAQMGSADARPDEAPVREVFLDPFSIDRYEVTNLQYRARLEASGASPPRHWQGGDFPAGTALHPVVGVSWQEAGDFCAASGKRLPSEAEWERACRGAEVRRYPWGDDWDAAKANVTLAVADLDAAWAHLLSDTPPRLMPVGFPPEGATPEGVCNLAGNASEWVADWYDATAYATLPDVNPVGEAPEWNHSLRGGAWLFRHDDPELMIDKSRCAFRNSSHSAADPRVGFRCAADG